MRKIFIGLLLAATAASPALAGKGGHGGGHGNHGGGKHAGGNPHGGGNPRHGGNPHGFHGGGGKHGGPAMAFVRPAAHGNRGGHGHEAERRWARPAPVRVARFDDKHARKAWKREAKDERKVARQWQRQPRFLPAERVVRVERHAPPRAVRYVPTREVRYVERPVIRYVQPRVIRYVEPRPVRYVTRSYAPVFYRQPVQYAIPVDRADGYYDYASVPRYPVSSYRPATSYSPVDPLYRSNSGGLFGSGSNGLLGALLPVVLQSVIGGDLGGLGGYGGLGGLTGLTGLGSPDVLPLQEASYAPYANGFGNTDLASMLLPSLLGSGSLF